ncbi:FmdB family zinc ribbon protein [Actinomadura madurae]|uniref:FmdB family zinc ribbon protein n=1 Tax=Actinomadura madurae TaxID=1993 RepID=UPI000D9EE55F|nr:FmdB family zinc ribbon protein [Actinomadura madurae]MCP9953440.1 FmdB family transcriptional regulator [Actinomadura madurae]MCP9970202.1 FmdB family transcriptional regulator [Actinomadura madurae]MCP9982665.1 FmdB family transcriptional regulator [Actinomadura madurae]MCQ0005788.1 FmdB family transcriptional regulator [Actinomadura madurae]MCQ0018905.1 FmdB family transcriptional regulator [Actinomadura madurae]
MPTYQYVCTECGEPLEVVQKFSDDALTECPACTGRLRKVFSAAGIIFKGSGFYRTDSRGSGKSSSTAGASANGSSNGSSGGDSGGDSAKSDSSSSSSDSSASSSGGASSSSTSSSSSSEKVA